MGTFATSLAELHGSISVQGQHVLDHLTRSVEAFFESDQAKARAVIANDDSIDKLDVEIERAAVPLLAMGSSDEHQIRSVLTIVKVNNELERIADIAVNIVEQVVEPGSTTERPPATFRVMANSVVGMVRDSVRSLSDSNAELARQVLLFDDTVDRFRNEILLHAQEQVALGTCSVRFAFRLTSVTKCLERIADHSTNICEQVIYLQTGKIVRHRPDGWSEPEAPAS
ncbi:MAG: phosphate signaling complex protein PhoU [Phycisphaerales bacterium]|nr:phosphate signaling complex protein PhoU [Phycisphaerales bacterium]